MIEREEGITNPLFTISPCGTKLLRIVIAFRLQASTEPWAICIKSALTICEKRKNFGQFWACFPGRKGL